MSRFSMLCCCCPIGSRKQDEAGNHDVQALPTSPTLGKSSSDDVNPFSEYGISSPPQGKHAQELSTAKVTIEKDGFGKYLAATQTSNKSEEKKGKASALVFLYGRGFYALRERKKRKEKVEAILKNPKAMERLQRVLQSGGADQDITLERRHMYRQLCQTLHLYFKLEGSFGFLRNMNDAKYYFRIQQQGNCFMHAPCVMMSYLLQSRDVVEGAYPVDISKFVRRSFNDEELFKYIAKDDGGRGRDMLSKMLDSIFEETSNMASYTRRMVQEKEFDLEGIMKKYGPVLVTGFNCHRHFDPKTVPLSNESGYIQFRGRHHSHGKFIGLGEDDEQHTEEIEKSLEEYIKSKNKSDQEHDAVPQVLFPSEAEGNGGDGGKDSGDAQLTSEGIDLDGGRRKEESHAMVLIGGRRDKRGKLFLLLQNWWDGMQLVEVDTDYYATCDPDLTIVDVPKEDFAKVDLASFYSTNNALVADSHCLDRADRSSAFDDGCFSYPQNDR